MTPNAQSLRIHRLVCSEGQSIKAVADAYGVSPATIRRRLDEVTEFNCKTFDLTLTGEQMLEVLGWLRNGNYTSGALADLIEDGMKSHERKKAERASRKRATMARI